MDHCSFLQIFLIDHRFNVSFCQCFGFSLASLQFSATQMVWYDLSGKGIMKGTVVFESCSTYRLDFQGRCCIFCLNIVRQDNPLEGMDSFSRSGCFTRG